MDIRSKLEHGLAYSACTFRKCHGAVPVVPESSVIAPAMNKTDVMSCRVCTESTQMIDVADFFDKVTRQWQT